MAKRKVKPAGDVDVKALSEALGALVRNRLSKPRRFKASLKTPTQWPPERSPERIVREALTEAQRRRRPRRVGVRKPYSKTTKLDFSRTGTFRHYMLALIRRHSNTWDANREHATCDNPKFAKNKLDFNWAADNGYINWE